MSEWVGREKEGGQTSDLVYQPNEAFLEYKRWGFKWTATLKINDTLYLEGIV